MKSKTIYGKAKAGKIELYDTYEYNKFVALLDGEIEIIIRPLQSKKTTAQDAYYRGVVLKILSDFTGYTKDEMHKVCMDEVGIESTRDLSRGEYSEYISAVKRFGISKLDCYIPNARTE